MARIAEKMEGCPVVDARRPLHIDVSEKDITRRGIKDPRSCAVARACSRALHGAEARVYLTRTYLKIGRKWQRYRTPATIRNEIIAFDRGGNFEPGTYTLQPIPASRRFGVRKNNETGPRKTKGKKPRSYRMTVNVRGRSPL